jgi:hypothetical protein
VQQIVSECNECYRHENLVDCTFKSFLKKPSPYMPIFTPSVMLVWKLWRLEASSLIPKAGRFRSSQFFAFTRENKTQTILNVKFCFQASKPRSIPSWLIRLDESRIPSNCALVISLPVSVVGCVMYLNTVGHNRTQKLFYSYSIKLVVGWLTS